MGEEDHHTLVHDGRRNYELMIAYKDKAVSVTGHSIFITAMTRSATAGV